MTKLESMVYIRNTVTMVSQESQSRGDYGFPGIPFGKLKDGKKGKEQ